MNQTARTFRLRLALTAALSIAASLVVYTNNPLARTAAAINTIGYEDSPYLSPDGTRLYFMYTPYTMWPVFYGRWPMLVGPERSGHHINRRNPWEDTDLYVATLDSGVWTTPHNLGFNDDQADCCAMTWDHRLFAYQRTQRPLSALTDLYFVQLSAGGDWIRTSAGSAVNMTNSSESNPHITADGRALYFSSNRNGGFGQMDLYVSYRGRDGSWQVPQNMGPTFNTRENEDQIWISRDQRTIYFSREPGPQILTSTWSEASGWSLPEPVLFGGRVVHGAEVSLNDDQTLMVFAEVRPDLEDIVFVYSERAPDARWGAPRPITSTPEN
jgi:hypothetical protein